jgi:hypothetical protein
MLVLALMGSYKLNGKLTYNSYFMGTKTNSTKAEEFFMLDKNFKDSKEQAFPTYPVMLVQAPYHAEEASISLIEIAMWFKRQWKSVFFIFFLSLLVALPILYKQSQLVNFQQVISVPTVIFSLDSNVQRKNILSSQAIISTYNATYWLNKQTESTLKSIKNFSLGSQLASSNGLDPNANNLAEGMLVFQAKAPIKDEAVVRALFKDSLTAVQQVVSGSVEDIKKFSSQKIKSDQENIVALIDQMKSGKVTSLASSIDYNQASNLDLLASQLEKAKATLISDQFALSSLQIEIKPIGDFVIGKPGSGLFVILKALAVALACALLMGLFLASVSLSMKLSESSKK